MPRPRVLLVEDNTFTRSTVAAALRVEGCLISAAVATAREAMAHAHQHEFDCAVVDLHLGKGPSGIDLAHGMRDLNPTLGIVILTSYSDPRLLSPDQPEPPPGTVYVLKNDVESIAQLRDFIDEAMEVNARNRRSQPQPTPLTDTQIEILAMVAQGLTNAEIARRRVTSERSVEITMSRIVKRLRLDPTDSENSRVLLAQTYYELIGGKGAQ